MNSYPEIFLDICWFLYFQVVHTKCGADNTNKNTNKKKNKQVVVYCAIGRNQFFGDFN